MIAWPLKKSVKNILHIITLHVAGQAKFQSLQLLKGLWFIFIHGVLLYYSHIHCKLSDMILLLIFLHPFKTFFPILIRPPTSRSLYSCSKIVDGVSCLSLAFLDSPIMLNTDEGESCPDITYLLVAGLQVCSLEFHVSKFITLQ